MISDNESHNNVVLVGREVSESSVRHACALIFNSYTEFPKVAFNDEAKEWQLYFVEVPSEEFVSRFHKVLNDFRIRELIDKDTGGVRRRIVSRALQNVYQNE